MFLKVYQKYRKWLCLIPELKKRIKWSYRFLQIIPPNANKILKKIPKTKIFYLFWFLCYFSLKLEPKMSKKWSFSNEQKIIIVFMRVKVAFVTSQNYTVGCLWCFEVFLRTLKTYTLLRARNEQKMIMLIAPFMLLTRLQYLCYFSNDYYWSV